MSEITMALEELADLIRPSYAANNEAHAIKLLMALSGASFADCEDFYEGTLVPFFKGEVSTRNIKSYFDLDEERKNTSKEAVETDIPPMFLVGHTYLQLNGSPVTIIGKTNDNTESETVYSIDSNGNTIHRYNRRDFGRVTGTDHNNPDPRNLIPLEK
jgi:hypothetical protein